MRTECVLCISACSNEHLSADPREWSSVQWEGGRGGRGSENHCLPSTMARLKRLCSSLCSSPPVSMETDTDPYLSLGSLSRSMADGRQGRGEGESDGERGMRRRRER